jgi:hypothetical protein
MRLLFFDLMDRYCALYRRSGDPSAILNAAFVESLAAGIGPDLGPLRQTIAEELRAAWAAVRDELWTGVPAPSIGEDGRCVVRRPDGSEELRLTKDELATQLLLAMRNTTHGFQLRDDRFRRYLIRHNHRLPEHVRYLALGFWFAFMSKPSTFWGDRANFQSLRLC